MLSFSVSAQITKVKEINDSGTKSSNPSGMFVFNNTIYFAADDSNGSNTGNADLGKELWKSDGTEAGTVFVKDIHTGSKGSNPNNFFELGNQLFFLANDGNGVSQIWKTDGTEAGTVNTNNGFSILKPVIIGNKAYTTATTRGNTFYEFDGTNSKEVPDAGSGQAKPLGGQYIAYDNNTIFLYMDYSTDEATIGRELYKYNISAQTYTLIKDINTGTGDASISNFTKLGNEVYFEALSKLWKTDGTEAGTVAVGVADKFNGVANLSAFDGKIFFEGDETTGGDQLVVYNPTTDKATNLTNFSGSSENHDPMDYVTYNGYLYYRGEEASTTTGHLYRTNGTTVELISNAIKDVDDLVVFNNKIYFEGDNGSTGNELYVLDTSVLSISTVKFDQALRVYPNPSRNNLINIQGNFNEEVTYKIFNILGKQVQAGNVLNNRINHNLSSGMYILNITSGKSSATRKIVVK